MSLLTPTESRSFRSFLDTAALPVDWGRLLEISREHLQPASGTEALTRATKDLMSLDGDSPVSSAQWQHHAQTSPLASPRLPLCHVVVDAKPNPSPCDRSPSSSSSSSSQFPADRLPRAPPAAKRASPPDARPSNKRLRPTAPDDAHVPSQSRTALLSPSQKKANHIQSEQKRRANIRRGYDALCETVPALREACRAEEAQLAQGKPRSRRRTRGAEQCDDDKIDGRAGPRSEHVVLSKTIDHLHALLSEREALMQRLAAARCALPPDHPLLRLRPDAPLPLWQRKWSGGEKGDEDDEDEDDDEDD